MLRRVSGALGLGGMPWEGPLAGLPGALARLGLAALGAALLAADARWYLALAAVWGSAAAASAALGALYLARQRRWPPWVSRISPAGVALELPQLFLELALLGTAAPEVGWALWDIGLGGGARRPLLAAVAALAAGSLLLPGSRLKF